jgi:monoamine oxidase
VADDVSKRVLCALFVGRLRCFLVFFCDNSTMATDVVVVGAGFAGLRAAQLLKKKGRRVIVLEARVRIGGRCQTGEYQGEHFDFGGHWIGAHQPRIRQMISDMGYHMKPQYDEGTHFLRMFGSSFKYSGNISSLNSFGDVLKEMTDLVAIWDREMLLVPLDDPSKSPKAQEFDSITLKQWQEKNVKSKEAETLMNFLLWTIFTVPANEVSYMWSASLHITLFLADRNKMAP